MNLAPLYVIICCHVTSILHYVNIRNKLTQNYISKLFYLLETSSREREKPGNILNFNTRIHACGKGISRNPEFEHVN
jgi:hypothetical protein